MSAPRACRGCGCTDDHACVDLSGQPCFWVEPDLCSECSDVVTMARAVAGTESWDNAISMELARRAEMQPRLEVAARAVARDLEDVLRWNLPDGCRVEPQFLILDDPIPFASFDVDFKLSEEGSRALARAFGVPEAMIGIRAPWWRRVVRRLRGRRLR